MDVYQIDAPQMHYFVDLGQGIIGDLFTSTIFNSYIAMHRKDETLPKALLCGLATCTKALTIIKTYIFLKLMF